MANKPLKDLYFQNILNYKLKDLDSTIIQMIRYQIYIELNKVTLYNKELHKEDILNECLIELWIRLDEFDTYKKSDNHVTSYLFKNIEGDVKIGRCIGVIRDYINSWFQAYYKDRKRIYTTTIEITPEIIKNFSVNYISGPEKAIIENEDYRETLKFIKSLLTKKQYYVLFENKIKEKSQKKIAEDLDITIQAVNRLLKRAIKNLNTKFNYHNNLYNVA